MSEKKNPQYKTDSLKKTLEDQTGLTHFFKYGKKSNKKCSFCKKQLPVNKNDYLKNRYKLAFWNNQKEDERLICYACLKYGWTRGLPLIDGKTSEGGWGKKRLFVLYQKQGKFKENGKN